MEPAIPPRGCRLNDARTSEATAHPRSPLKGHKRGQQRNSKWALLCHALVFRDTSWARCNVDGRQRSLTHPLSARNRAIACWRVKCALSARRTVSRRLPGPLEYAKQKGRKFPKLPVFQAVGKQSAHALRKYDSLR